MIDLVVGILIQFGVWLAGFSLGTRLGRIGSLRRARAMALPVVGAVCVQMFWVSDRLRLASWLPFSNLVILANLIPGALGVLGGLTWSLLPREGAYAGRGLLVRRIVLVLLLFGLSGYSVVKPLWGKPPRCLDRWEGDVCIQTTEKSCSAACAVTLLKSRGIPATEQELAEFCLTRDGTSWLGLYRGLTLKTRGTPHSVEVIGGTFDDLKSLGKGPMILDAGIPRGMKAAAIYTERYGWEPGEMHSVLFYGFRGDGKVDMGDPSPGIGREQWTEDDLRTLWRGSGLRLIP